MLVKIVKAVLLLMYALVFGEFFVRFMDPQPIMPRYVQGSDDGIRMNVPNSTYQQITPEINVEVRINSQGIRSDREIGYEKPVDVCRMVMLGDSFMMGYEVSVENSFAYLVEKNLAGAGIKAEQINLAVSGFGTAEHLIALRRRGASFNPDLVIMEWHSTDPKDNKRSNLFKVANGQITQKNDTYLPAIKIREQLMRIPGYEWLIGNSHLYSAVRESVALFIKKFLLSKKKNEEQAIDEVNVISENGRGPEKRYPSKLDELLIQEVRKFADGIGATLVMFDVPVEKKEANTVASAYEFLDLDLLQNINMISPYPEFKEASEGGERLYYERGHGHWTIEGNQLAAKVMANAIIDNGWCD